MKTTDIRLCLHPSKLQNSFLPKTSITGEVNLSVFATVVSFTV